MTLLGLKFPEITNVTSAKKRMCFVLPSTTDNYTDIHAVANANLICGQKTESDGSWLLTEVWV